MFDCILLCAGSGTRTNLNYNKVLFEVNNKCLYEYSIDLFLGLEEVGKVILVVSENDYDYFNEQFELVDRVDVVIGGKERSDSVYNGLKCASSDIVLIHDGARPNINKEEVLNVYNEALINKAACLAVKAKDTIKVVDNGFINETLDRSVLWQMQTPQGVNRLMMLEGLEKIKNQGIIIYDDVFVFEKVFNIKPKIVLGSYENIKVTTEEDLDYIKYLIDKKNGLNDNKKYRVGHSNDVHELVEGRKLMLGGIEIPFEKGLLGHSDGDAVLHAVSESIIGALGKVDIGYHFSDKDPKYEGMDSSYFVSETVKMMESDGYEINNIDILIFCEKPHLSKYKELMKDRIAYLLHTDRGNVNVKATRKEGLGYIGEGKAIEAESYCLLKKADRGE